MQHLLSALTNRIVQPAELLARDNPNRLFIDVRLGDPPLELQSYREGHIAGAVHAQIRDVFAAPPGPTTGNLPLPDPARLQQQLEQWGVDAESEVVVYGPSPALAARAWWVLTWAGLANVRLLDGGLKAWVNHGGAVAQGDSRPRLKNERKPLHLPGGMLPAIAVEEVEQLGPETLLIDARDEASWLAGCIPRAINLPAAELWNPASSLRTAREIRERLAQADVTVGRDVVVYCGGGVLSALTALTLMTLGLRPRLFVGSWSEWNKHPQRMARSASERTSA